MTLPMRLLVLATAGLCLPLSAAAQTVGCTDSRAQNYDASATSDDGSCTYRDTVLAPVTQVLLDTALVETSGLAFVGDQLYSHNDSDDEGLYLIDTTRAQVIQRLSLAMPAPFDWEGLAIVEGQVYIGDFGNNGSGNRRDLRILRLALDDLLAGRTAADTLHFAYADQTDFTPQPGNTTDFDCEAFFVTTDSVYLLTKEWTGQQTQLYTFANRPGRHLAQSRGRLPVNGLVTDASYRPQDGTLVLLGYTSTLQPFAYLLYDFEGTDVFGGHGRRVGLGLPFHQVEGIASRDGRRYYVSNERFSRSIITVPQRLSVFEMGGLLASNPIVSTREPAVAVELDGPAFYPNPVQEVLRLHSALLPAIVMLRNSAGRIVLAKRVASDTAAIDVSLLPAGAYQVSVADVPYGTLVKAP